MADSLPSTVNQSDFRALRDLLVTRIATGTAPELIQSVIPALLSSIADIATNLRHSPVSALDTSNTFGDTQLNVDVSSENILRSYIAACPSIATASSEEDPIERRVNAASAGETYTIAFDPLDGSSIIAPNWTVGTIIGVWTGSSALNAHPSKQICSILGVHGPRTTAVLALRLPGCEDICIDLAHGPQGWEVVQPQITLLKPPFKTRYFAPANLRCANEDERYMSFITNMIAERGTLRYAGGLVPDIVHMLVKGQGLYISPVTETSKAKLRRLYELAPIALVMECAGGMAIEADGQRILEKVIGDCDERAGLVCGSKEEVEKVIRHFGWA